MASRSKRLRKSKSSRARKRRLAQSQKSQLDFLTLEPRNLLAAVVVSTANDFVSPTADVSSISGLIANDGGDGISLREAITAANNTTGEDAITFDGSVFSGGDDGLIRLTQGELVVNERLTIDGTSVGGVLITGDANGDDVTIRGTNITDVSASFGGVTGAAEDLLDDNSRVLNFLAPLDTPTFSENLTLVDLTITGGRNTFEGSIVSRDGRVFTEDDEGGGISFNSAGTLRLNQSLVSGNSTTGQFSNGGGIGSPSGIIVLTNSTVSGNQTSGRSGGGGGIGVRGSGSVSLSNSTVSGNTTTGQYSGGGGIYTNFGTVSLTNNSLVSGNSTSGYKSYGGGIGAFNGSISLLDSIVSGNATSGILALGGGISNSTGDVSISSSTVSFNRTMGDVSHGGGIRTFSGSVSLLSSTVSENYTVGSGSDGGGIFSRSGSVSLRSSTLSENSTSGGNGFGGGISTESGDVSLRSSTLEGNSTTGQSSYGGGIRTDSGNVFLINSTLSVNSTYGAFGHGGGILTVEGDVSLLNSTVSGNTTNGTDSNSGGISARSGSVSLSNSTVTGNSSMVFVGGIGIFTEGSLTLLNSIVAGNSTVNFGFPDLLESDRPLIVENSLIGSTSGTGIRTSTGTGNILNQPALLAPLADNGGPTGTHALLEGSLAIDAGRNALVSGLSIDQRGAARIANAIVDIGAFEFESPTIGPKVTSVVRDEGGVLARPDLLTTFAVTFDQDVNVDLFDLSVINDTAGNVLLISDAGFSYDTVSQTATWDFSSLLSDLDASFYTFRLSDTITGVVSGQALDGDSDGTAGGNHLESIYVAIPGDANLDGDVEVNEINLFWEPTLAMARRC